MNRTFELKQRSTPRNALNGEGSTIVLVNKESGTIAVSYEDGYFWLVDRETLVPISGNPRMGDGVEDIVFNPDIGMYVCTYSMGYSRLVAFSPNGTTCLFLFFCIH